MNVLILNVGSSSIKYVVFKDKKELLKGEIERIGLKDPYLKENNKTIKINVKNFSDALNFILKRIKDIKIDFIGHRIVHGGDIKKASLIFLESLNF